MNELMITKLNPDTGRERSANTGFMEDKIDPNSLWGKADKWEEYKNLVQQ